MPKTIACIVGTRPEAVKMAPVILALRRQPWARVVVVLTAQHRELADEVLRMFEIAPDYDLDLMRPNQTLPALTARAITRLDGAMAEIAPDLVLAQGDTTTVMATAMVCFYRELPFLHVEAGLRSHDLQNPFPEEFNRILAGRVAALHFAPTEGARRHLLREGVAADKVIMTGNTVIDALWQVAGRVRPPEAALIEPGRRLLLATVHRRENFGQPTEEICRAFLTLVETNPDVVLLWPVHPNPNVARVARRQLGKHERIRLVAPLAYIDFVAAMTQATLILSDSGGVQEEAAALAKPVLVLRRETERPDAIEAGVARLIGTDCRSIVEAAQALLDDPELYRTMARGVSPYGDGHASDRIVRAIAERWGRDEP
jgi:UDP-N-acetylglucosamine 2-epimerase (non-hydrolysing)